MLIAPVLTPGRIVDRLIEAAPQAVHRFAMAREFGVHPRTVERLVAQIRLRWGIPVESVKSVGAKTHQYRLIDRSAIAPKLGAFSKGPRPTKANSTPGGAA